MKNNPYVRQALFVLALTAFCAFAFTSADFIGMPFKGLSDLAVLAMQFCTVSVATMLLMWIASTNRYVFAALFPPFCAVCAAVAYFRFTANVTLTPMAIDLALVNDARTTMDVVTWQLIAWVLLCVAVAVGAVTVRWRMIKVRHEAAQTVVAVLALCAFNSIGRLQLPVRSRIPFVVYNSVESYMEGRRIVQAKRPAFGGTPRCTSDTLDVVFILGETLRSKNMQANGYTRPTTPWLCREQGAVSLPNIHSEYGFTHTSVPYILTLACPADPEAAYRERSFIDIFKRAGYRTTWIANQESVETFVYFMNEADTLVYLNSGKSVYVFDKWLDGDILPELDKQMATQREAPRRLFVMHTIGSHWWYKAHYPESYARWKPELKSRVMSANSHEEFVNSYDNTVLYSDWFWLQVRNRFRNRNAVVVYLSDHSENLGENGLYGHGEDTPPLHRPGCWVWMSDRYRAAHPQKWAALKTNRNRPYNSAFLFHSLLDAADINTKYIDRKYDIFRHGAPLYGSQNH